MRNSKPDFARAMAKALEEAGVVSDVTESDPNPLWAAQQAFAVCHGGVWPDDWREYNESLSEESVPPAHRHWKLAALCRRALRDPRMRNDLREQVAYAWGYFTALLPLAMRRRA